MEISQIESYLAARRGEAPGINAYENYPKLWEDLRGEFDKEHKKTKEYLNQFDIYQHSVMDHAKRQDKIVTYTDDDGKPVTESVPVNRVPLSLQRLIANLATSFLCGRPVKLKAQVKEGSSAEGMKGAVDRTWFKLKMNYRLLEICRLMCCETEVAVILYADDAEPEYWQGTVNEKVKKAVRLRVIANSKGDTLYPVWNSVGNMVAFGRGYTSTDKDSNTIQHFDFYTADKEYRGKQLLDGTGWEVKTYENPIKGKIQVVYWSQPEVEWHEVQPIIERLEDIISNLGDTNDYNGSPMLLLEGEIESLAKKGERGKAVKLKDGAKASYLVWNQAPESVKLEWVTLMRLIYVLTDTPETDFESIKGIGHLSQFTVKMLFMAPHQKAARKEGIFGEGVQRLINLVKYAMTVFNPALKESISLEITPEFEYFLPKNDAEMISTLVEAVSGKIMSRKSATAQNPFVQDTQAEIDQLEAEAQEEADRGPLAEDL